MKNLSLSNVKESTNGLTPGGYVVKILEAEDFPDKEYLRLKLDIAAGPNKDHYKDLDDRFGFWGLYWYMSYKQTALSLFKAGINAIRKSNADFTWEDDAENDEKTLVGCMVGAVLREEEYLSNDGEVKSNVKFYKAMSITDIQEGKYTVPPRKVLESHNTANEVIDTTATFQEVDEKDIPF